MFDLLKIQLAVIAGVLILVGVVIGWFIFGVIL